MKYIAAFIIFILVITAIPFSDVRANSSGVKSQETISEGKLIVSMVYDDSESMHLYNEGKREIYCNYAFQLFLSMFDKKDELYITYMSNPKKSVDLSIRDKGRQEVVDSIRQHQSGISTPIMAVETAYEKLVNVKGGPNDRYWLVIISDGEFYSTQGKMMQGNYLDSYFNMYTSENMPNNSKINISFLGIGDDVVLPKEDISNNIHVDEARDEHALLNVMNKNAEMFSGCCNPDVLKCTNVQKLDSRSIIIDSEITLSRIIISAQNTKQQIYKCVDEQGQEQKISDQIELNYTSTNYESNTKTELYGTTGYIENDNGIIPAGKYTITFEEDVDMSNVTVYTMPAIEIKVELLESGTEKVITDYSTIAIGDRVDAGYAIYEKGTSKQWNAEDISNAVSYEFSITDNQGETENLIKANKPKDIFASNVSILDTGVTFKASVAFGSMLAAMDTLNISMYELESLGLEKEPIKRNQLHKNKDGITFQLCRNGEPLLVTDVNRMSIHAETSKRFSAMKFHTSIQNDGTIKIVPYYGKKGAIYQFLFGWLVVWRIPLGEIPITLKVGDSETLMRIHETVEETMHSESLFLTIWCYLQPFLMLLLMVGFIFKCRFSRGFKVSYARIRMENDAFVCNDIDWEVTYLTKRFFKYFHTPTSIYSFIPFVKNRKNVGGIVFCASSYLWKDNCIITVKAEEKIVALVETSSIKSQEKIQIRIISDRIELNSCNRLSLKNGKGFIATWDNKLYLYKISRGRSRI